MINLKWNILKKALKEGSILCFFDIDGTILNDTKSSNIQWNYGKYITQKYINNVHLIWWLPLREIKYMFLELLRWDHTSLLFKNLDDERRTLFYHYGRYMIDQQILIPTFKKSFDELKYFDKLPFKYNIIATGRGEHYTFNLLNRLNCNINKTFAILSNGAKCYFNSKLILYDQVYIDKYWTLLHMIHTFIKEKSLLASVRYWKYGSIDVYLDKKLDLRWSAIERTLIHKYILSLQTHNDINCTMNIHCYSYRININLSPFSKQFYLHKIFNEITWKDSNIKYTAHIGNSYNDIPLFKAVDFSFTFNDCDESVKKYADFIIPKPYLKHIYHFFKDI